MISLFTYPNFAYQAQFRGLLDVQARNLVEKFQLVKYHDHLRAGEVIPVSIGGWDWKPIWLAAPRIIWAQDRRISSDDSASDSRASPASALPRVKGK